jgi:ribulose-phosphate 3-epimerase
MKLRAKVLPSLLAADFGDLRGGARLAESAGGDALHMDIMDGHFVPNLSMGPDVVKMAKNSVKIPLSVHLMISNPDKLVPAFLDAGADIILIHIEVDCDVPAILKQIRSGGRKAGITLNPATPAEAVFPVLENVDQVLCMTVQPGFGGQSFRPEVLPKIRAIRDRLNKMKRGSDILVDGGINHETALKCAEHGANAFVAGVFLYKSRDMAAEIRRMRDAAQNLLQ